MRLRQAADNSGEVVFITDAKGIFTFVSPEFTRVYGYREAEVAGKLTPRILKGDGQPAEKYTECLETLFARRVARKELVNKAKDGHLLTVQGSASPIVDESGKIMGFPA